MPKEELIELLQETIAVYLKENLKVEVCARNVYDFDSNGVRVEVKILLDGQVIDKDSDFVVF